MVMLATLQNQVDLVLLPFNNSTEGWAAGASSLTGGMEQDRSKPHGVQERKELKSSPLNCFLHPQ